MKMTIQPHTCCRVIHVRVQGCRWSVAILLFLCSVVLNAHALLAANSNEYVFDIVARSGDVIDGRRILGFGTEDTSVVINNGGEVAFLGLLEWQNQSGWGVMTSRRFVAGAGVQVGGIVPEFNDDDHSIDINGSGHVVYTAFHPDGGLAVFVDDSLRYQVGDVVGGATIDVIRDPVEINDVGQVVYHGLKQPSGRIVFVDDAVVVQENDVISGQRMGGFFGARINDRGDAAFIGSVRSDKGSQFDAVAIANRTEVLIQPGDVIDGIKVSRVRDLGAILNDGTVVAQIALSESPSAQLKSAIITQDRALLLPGDIIDGIDYQGVLASSRVVMNETKQLAFMTWNQDPVPRRRLFVSDTLVVSEGDVIGSKTIARLQGNFDLNEFGSVAFRVEFEDGSRAIVRGVVPEPSTSVLVPSVVLLLFGRRLVLR